MAGYFMIFSMSSLPWELSIPIVILSTIALGFVIERSAYAPLRTAPRMSIMISAIGVSYLLQNLATYLFSALPKPYPEIPFLKRIFEIGSVSASLVTFVTPIVAILLVWGLTQLINHTKIGMAMRAVSKDFETSKLMGIKINTVISVTFLIGSALAVWGRSCTLPTACRSTPSAARCPGSSASWRRFWAASARCRARWWAGS
jgi:branched-chain amino acid transport system permease protein